MDQLEDNRDAVTKMDITLHDKSQDLTDARIRLDDENIYGTNEHSHTDIHPDYMMKPEFQHNGKSYDVVDSMPPLFNISNRYVFGRKCIKL
jgi:hypothetical protein